MNDKHTWAISARTILEQTGLNRNVSWKELLNSAIRTYRDAEDDFGSGRPFARLDQNVMAYMIAFLFAGDPEDVHSDAWVVEDGRVVNRNVSLIVGPERAGWPSDVLGKFVESCNARSDDVDELAIDFCQTMTEVIDCMTIYRVVAEAIGESDERR